MAIFSLHVTVNLFTPKSVTVRVFLYASLATIDFALQDIAATADVPETPDGESRASRSEPNASQNADAMFTEPVDRVAAKRGTPDAGSHRRILKRLAQWWIALSTVAAAIMAVLGWQFMDDPYPAPKASGSYSVVGGEPVGRGAMLTTEDEQAYLVLGGYCRVKLGPNSKTRVEGTDRDESIVLEQGGVVCDVDRGKGTFKVHTDLGTVSVLGTKFEVTIQEEDETSTRQMLVEVIDGSVLVTGTAEQTTTLAAGERMIIGGAGDSHSGEIQRVATLNKDYWAPAAKAGLRGELGILDLRANRGINPATGEKWQEGDQYRLVFVSSATKPARLTRIAGYNFFVQGLANAVDIGADKGVSWKAIGSTIARNAIENTDTFPTKAPGVSVWLIDGKTIVANNYTDLWDGSIQNPINLTEEGQAPQEPLVWTGSAVSGKVAGGEDSGSDEKPEPTSPGLSGLDGPQLVTYGNNESSTSRWIDAWRDDRLISLHVYAISSPLTITSTVDD